MYQPRHAAVLRWMGFWCFCFIKVSPVSQDLSFPICFWFQFHNCRHLQLENPDMEILLPAQFLPLLPLYHFVCVVLTFNTMTFVLFLFLLWCRYKHTRHSAYLGLLILLPPIQGPTLWPYRALLSTFFGTILNNYGDKLHPYCTPFNIRNHSAIVLVALACAVFFCTG